MAASSLCNGYFQAQEPHKLKDSNRLRCAQISNTAIQALVLVSALFEPFIPSFSAKVYEQLNYPRTDKCELFYEFYLEHKEDLKNLVKPDHQIGEVAPIFKEISEEFC